MSLTQEKFQTDEERDAMLELVRRTGSERDVCLIEALIFTGARPSEVLNLMASDLYANQKSILIRGLKGSRDREIGLPSDVFSRLKVYAETQESVIFDITTRRLRQIWSEYAPQAQGRAWTRGKSKGKSPRSARHGAAVRAMKRTENPKLVQNLLGHKSIANTSIYMDYLIGQNEFRKALK